MLLDIISRPDYLGMIELMQGSERTVARVSVRDGHLPQFLDYVGELKLDFGILPAVPESQNIFGAYSDLDRHDDEHEVYLAKNVFEVREAISTVEEYDHFHMGVLFGYPECCIKAFKNVSHGTSQESRCMTHPYLTDAMLKTRITPRINRFLKIMTPLLEERVLSFFPCAFDCEDSIRIASLRAHHMKIHHDWEPQPTVLTADGWKIHFNA